MRQREEAETLRFARVSASRTEGEGFEPSSDLTARNGFRDRHEHADLQGFCILFASLFASHQCLTQNVFAVVTTLVLAVALATWRRAARCSVLSLRSTG